MKQQHNETARNKNTIKIHVIKHMNVNQTVLAVTRIFLRQVLVANCESTTNSWTTAASMLFDSQHSGVLLSIYWSTKTIAG